MFFEILSGNHLAYARPPIQPDNIICPFFKRAYENGVSKLTTSLWFVESVVEHNRRIILEALLFTSSLFCYAEVLVEGRKYEALATGQEQLQHLGDQNIDVHGHSYSRERNCSKCDTTHKPRQCPTYHGMTIATSVV